MDPTKHTTTITIDEGQNTDNKVETTTTTIQGEPATSATSATSTTSHTISGSFIFSQLIQGSILLSILDRESLLLLAQVGKEIANLIIKHIEERYSFNFCGLVDIKELSVYKPVCVTIDSVSHLTSMVQKYTTITQIKFSPFFNKPITQFPSQITEIIFGFTYNQIFSHENLPSHIVNISFGYRYNSLINLASQPTILKISFGFTYNQILSRNNLPPNISHLNLGKCFNQNIDELPPNITHLTFDKFSNFNHHISNYPPRLSHLTHGYYYNQRVDNLALTLINAIFGESFDHEITRVPPNLKLLIVGSQYSHLQKLKSFSATLQRSGCKVYVQIGSKLQSFVYTS